MISRNCFI